MPPKKGKGGGKKEGGGAKLSTEQQAIDKANAVDDNFDEDYKKSLRWECRNLEKSIKREEDLTGLYNDERLRVNYFWLVGKKELEDKQAELRNKNREYQDLEEKNSITIKIWRQRLKHLMFQNVDQQTQLKKDAQIKLKNSEDEHRINERELKQDLRALKVSKKEQETRHTEYVNALTKHFSNKQTEIRKEYERISNEIQVKYKHKMARLRKEMDEKRKIECRKIEAKKNEAIAQLKTKHEKKYFDIKEYYTAITKTNLDLIRTLRGDLKLEKAKDTQANKERLVEENNSKLVVGPLESIGKEVNKLLQEKIAHDEVKTNLIECQQKISETETTYKTLEWEYEVKLQQYQYLEAEKKQLFEEFHKIVYELHQKTGLRNLVLEKKLETIQESLETKDAQINQILATARIDPQAMGMIRSTLEEVE